jgi:polyphosphate kinase 2
MAKLKKKDYERHLEPLQVALNDLAHWLKHTGKRMVVLFEGRDTAGKGGAIHAIAERLNPRQVHIAALPKPTAEQQSQWYFQRYVAHLPSAGELVLFDRSWYNRAGVEHVMGYCSKAEYERFLQQVPIFERMLVDDGILLFKYWLAVDQVHQEERFAERAEDPLKRWKLSPIDLEARKRYADYGAARDAMIAASSKKHAPWYVVDFNDQRRGRLNLIRHLLDAVPDCDLPEKPLVLPKLSHKPKREHYPKWLKPIRNRY